MIAFGAQGAPLLDFPAQELASPVPSP